MERISRHNYEAFFLDHLEGNLSAQQEFELMDFLDKNPDLKAELDADLMDMQLQDVGASVMDKSSLKREGIQPDEVDNLMIASVEGDLSANEAAELVSYVEENGLQTSFVYYQSTVLKPDRSETYGDTSDLKKKDRLFVPIYLRIAAGVIVVGSIIGLATYNWSDDETSVSNLSVQTIEQEEEILFSKNQPSTVNEISDPVEEIDDELTSNENYLTGIEDEEPIHNMVHQLDPLNEEEPQTSDLIDEDPTVNDVKIDTSSIDPIKDSNPDKIEPVIEDKPLDTKQEEIKSQEQYKKEKANIISEEPIKVITDIAGNLLNRDVHYTRDRQTSNDKTVKRHFKLGKFEFEQKKH